MPLQCPRTSTESMLHWFILLVRALHSAPVIPDMSALIPSQSARMSHIPEPAAQAFFFLSLLLHLAATYANCELSCSKGVRREWRD